MYRLKYFCVPLSGDFGVPHWGDFCVPLGGFLCTELGGDFCVPLGRFLCTTGEIFACPVCYYYCSCSCCRGAKKTKYPHLGCGKMTAMATRGAELPWYSMLIRNHCYDSEVVGWVKPGHRFVSLVRASEQTRRGEAACGRETMCLLWFAGSTARCAARARGRGAGVGPCAACPSFGAVLRI